MTLIIIPVIVDATVIFSNLHSAMFVATAGRTHVCFWWPTMCVLLKLVTLWIERSTRATYTALIHTPRVKGAA